MPSREHSLRRATRRTQSQLRTIGEELRLARVSAGLRQADVASAIGVSQPYISRIERGVRRIEILDAARAAHLVGLELSVRLFPAGPPLRDKAHLALISRFRARISPSFRWQVEVPLPILEDRRALDILLTLGDVRIGVEVEVRLRDLQAVLRRLELKERDGGLEHMVLLLAATKTNRLAVRGSERVLREALPLRPREVLRALEAGRMPCANGYVLL